VLAKQREISEVTAKLAEKRVSYQLEARKLLTPEQIAALPPGCAPGFGNLAGGRGMGPGPGYGAGRGMGGGYGRGPCWR
jgi:Spy/CpxP family protein refolding chaperone